MSLRLLAAAWVLVTLDGALMGYRLAMGRSLAIDKRRRFQRASLRGALAVQLPIAAVASLAAGLSRRGGAIAPDDLDAAMARFVAVGGAYAAIILAGTLLCIVPSVTVRTAASVAIFGPFTLLRPVVAVLTVGAAVAASPTPAMVLLGVVVVVPGVLVEPLLDRRIAAELLAEGPRLTAG